MTTKAKTRCGMPLDEYRRVKKILEPERKPMTTKAQHTPGPWKEGPFQVYVGAWRAKNEWKEIADCTLGPDRQREMTDEERKANLRLIAAAPELVAALDGLLTEFERRDWPEGGPWVGLCNRMDIARALLARIEGKE